MAELNPGEKPSTPDSPSGLYSFLESDKLKSSVKTYRGHGIRRDEFPKLMQHMEEISGDPSGSEPSDYLNEEDLAVFERFLAFAENENWPNSVTLDMRTCSINGIAAWKNSTKTTKAGLTKRLFFPVVGGVHIGYSFAKLGINQSQRVAICDDGKLRSLRGPELLKSYGIGWGRLPDADLLIPPTYESNGKVEQLGTLSVGCTAIEYGTGPIINKLAAYIPIKTLAGHIK